VANSRGRCSDRCRAPQLLRRGGPFTTWGLGWRSVHDRCRYAGGLEPDPRREVEAGDLASTMVTLGRERRAPAAVIYMRRSFPSLREACSDRMRPRATWLPPPPAPINWCDGTGCTSMPSEASPIHHELHDAHAPRSRMSTARARLGEGDELREGLRRDRRLQREKKRCARGERDESKSSPRRQRLVEELIALKVARSVTISV
jgi:hypothetical protein